jgi:hypothetical protein
MPAVWHKRRDQHTQTQTETQTPTHTLCLQYGINDEQANPNHGEYDDQDIGEGDVADGGLQVPCLL